MSWVSGVSLWSIKLLTTSALVGPILFEHVWGLSPREKTLDQSHFF